MWCVAPVAGTYDATAYIHPRDRHLLADPMAAMSPDTASMLLGGKYEFAEPDSVAELADLETLELAGLRFTVDHTPGHTEGSVTFRMPYGEQGVSEVMLSGDLLFAGSIGRTDRSPTTSWSSPATASRRASAASARRTRSCSTCCATPAPAPRPRTEVSRTWPSPPR